MNEMSHIRAKLLVSSHCPHCHTLERLLRERLNNGLFEHLDVINIEQSPEIAQQYQVRSVPWLQLGEFIFEGGLTPGKLDEWFEYAKTEKGQVHYIAHLLEHGGLAKAIEWIEQGKTSLQAVVDILAIPETKLNVRIGIGAILEHFEDTDEIRAIISNLVALLQDKDPTVRTDVCHYLSLTHSKEAIESLQKMIDDMDPQVRQVAQESIESLSH